MAKTSHFFGTEIEYAFVVNQITVDVEILEMSLRTHVQALQPPNFGRGISNSFVHNFQRFITTLVCIHIYSFT